MAAAVPSYAETPPSRAALLGLARGFVDKVGGGFERADRYLATIMPDDARADESFVDIPDGEILLLRVSLGQTKLSDTVMGIKQGRDVMLSMRDFTSLARFAITVKPEEGLADGWYIREAQKFSLDTKTGAVTAGNRTYTAGPADMLVQDDDIYVRAQALGEWLDFNVKIVFSDQMAIINPEQKWPVQMQLARRGQRIAGRETPPQLPREFVDYTAASVPNVDLSVRQAYKRSGVNGESDSSTFYTATGAGDFLGHTLRSTLTGNDTDRLSEARLTFSKSSDKPELLGPMGARKYEFGDIASSRVPLAGTARGGLGVRVTSAPENLTTSAATVITGDATPGWDVELTRNGTVLGTLTVTADGRYTFDNVPLNAGENLFMVTQYGPLGEIREEYQRVVSSASLAGGDKAIYDVSVTAADTETYSKNDEKTADEGNLQYSGLYEMQVTPEMTASAGARSVTVADDRKLFGHLGAARSFGSVLVNANTGYDFDGSVAADLGMRGRLFDQALGVSFSYLGEDYGLQAGASSPASYGVMTTAGGRIYDKGGFQVYYDGESEYRFVDDGGKTFESRAGVNASYMGVNVGQSVRSLRQQDALGNDDKRTDGSTSIRGGILGTRVRAAVNYVIKPEFDVSNYSLDLTRRLARNVRGNLRFDHEPSNDYTEARASLNWNAGPFALSPSVSYDTENNLGAYLALNSSLSYDPATGKADMSGRSMTNSGGFSAFVYLDKDGDMKFTEGADEPVRDASLRAVQARITALTDDDGEAFISTLPAGRATDVMVDEGSLPDPFWVTAFEGVSVLPRPGFTAHVEFPLHMAGEIDGTLRLRREGGTASALRGVMLYLYNAEGRRVRETASASDGFYIFERVPPGRYLLMVGEEDAKRYRFVRGKPQEIVVGYEGTTLYGNDITVDGGTDDVPIGFGADFADYLAANPHITQQDLAAGTVVLNLGSYRSQLLMGVVWYKVQARYAAILGRARLLVPPSQSYAVPKTGFHKLLVELPGVGMEDAFQRCRQLAARGQMCGVEVVPAQGLKAASAPQTGMIAQ